MHIVIDHFIFLAYMENAYPADELMPLSCKVCCTNYAHILHILTLVVQFTSVSNYYLLFYLSPGTLQRRRTRPRRHRRCSWKVSIYWDEMYNMYLIHKYLFLNFTFSIYFQFFFDPDWHPRYFGSPRGCQRIWKGREAGDWQCVLRPRFCHLCFWDKYSSCRVSLSR